MIRELGQIDFDYGIITADHVDPLIERNPLLLEMSNSQKILRKFQDQI